ncbi:MAG TPA: ABC transporter permease [Pyrinomonadaceae bacterium]|nr:ABC transporter permease [Pyrinomonadaceae bacterium]
MTKFLAVVKREYLQRVRSKMFIVATVLGPLMMVLFTVVPAFVFGIKTGGATHIAIIDQSGRMYERVRESILRGYDERAGAEAPEKAAASALNANTMERIGRAGEATEASYHIEEVPLARRPLEDVKRELSARVRRGDLDAYIILPPDILLDGRAEYYGRNVGDVITREQIEDRLSRAVREQRMADANIDESRVRELSRPVTMSTIKISDRGEEEDSGGGFFLVFTVGFIIYLTLIMYGQVILSAVIEEKETRIAEILFSSMRAFPLMMGKLIGVSLVALTQYAIWGLAVAMFALYGIGALVSRGVDISLPQVPLSFVIYFFLFFLLGYFIYATIYALVGSMVTTTQEGGQVALPVIFLLIVGFYLAFPVIRSPNSSFAFWVSMFPFFSPITMLVRIVTQTPPFWEIALSLLIGFGTVILLIWLAARIYRTGMLMYGKRATIPEVLRWVRQA